MSYIPKDSVTVQYVVLYGPKKLSERSCSTFSGGSGKKLAYDYFKEKERDGYWVDVFKKLTTITVEKITDDKKQ